MSSQLAAPLNPKPDIKETIRRALDRGPPFKNKIFEQTLLIELGLMDDDEDAEIFVDSDGLHYVKDDETDGTITSDDEEVDGFAGADNDSEVDCKDEAMSSDDDGNSLTDAEVESNQPMSSSSSHFSSDTSCLAPSANLNANGKRADAPTSSSIKHKKAKTAKKTM